jgi:hypothetical protein
MITRVTKWATNQNRNPQVQRDTKKRELLKNPTKIEEIKKKKNY